VEELRPGLWTWTARHPEWTPGQGGPEGWDPDVHSYAYQSGRLLVLFDPLAPPDAVYELARGKDVVILLTYNGHERSTPELVERLTCAVYAPAVSRNPLTVPASPYAVGDSLPGDVKAATGFYPNEGTFWIARHSALVIGDTLIGDGRGGLRLQPRSWMPETLSPDDFKRGLSPLLELPVELILLTHSVPVVEDAAGRLRRVLTVGD
jgi:hypothetical protein